MTPTEMAEMNLEAMIEQLKMRKLRIKDPIQADLFNAMMMIADTLNFMNAGQRATHALVEDVKEKLGRLVAAPQR